jgi:hypothetical protein
VRRSGSLAASRHAPVHILSRRRRTPARSIGCVSSHSTGRKREGNNRCSVNGGPRSPLSLPIPPAGKSHRRPAKATARDQSSQPALPLQTLDRTTLPLLPMEIGIGDRLMDQEFEWEVRTRPAALHGGKSLRVRIRRPGLPESEREITWRPTRESRVGGLDDRPPPGHPPRHARFPRVAAARRSCS